MQGERQDLKARTKGEGRRVLRYPPQATDVGSGKLDVKIRLLERRTLPVAAVVVRHDSDGRCPAKTDSASLALF